MNQVKRYGGYVKEAVQRDDGYYVEYSAYEKLRAELKTVISIGVDGQREVNHKLTLEIATLRASAEMLVSALETIACGDEDRGKTHSQPENVRQSAIANNALSAWRESKELK